MILPAANSLLDWVSIRVTRSVILWWTKPRASASGTLWRFTWGVTVDLIVAVLCVCGLAALLTAGVAGLNAVLGMVIGEAALVVDWMAMMGTFRADPFGEGLMVTLMLFSTLLPTVFHLTAGTVAVLKLPHLGRDYVVQALAAGPPAPSVRLGVAAVIVSVWLVPLFVWTVLLLLFLRFFVPLSWPPQGPGDFLLLSVPYWIAEWVWTLLGG